MIELIMNFRFVGYSIALATAIAWHITREVEEMPCRVALLMIANFLGILIGFVFGLVWLQKQHSSLPQQEAFRIKYKREELVCIEKGNCSQKYFFTLVHDKSGYMFDENFNYVTWRSHGEGDVIKFDYDVSHYLKMYDLWKEKQK